MHRFNVQQRNNLFVKKHKLQVVMQKLYKEFNFYI